MIPGNRLSIVDVRNGAGQAKAVAKAPEAAKAMRIVEAMGRAKAKAKAMELDGADGSPKGTVIIAKTTSMKKMMKKVSVT
jgi:hypothetical protein